MRHDRRIVLALSLLAIGLTGCASLGIATSLTSSAIAGAFYVNSQKVERTFAASTPEVKEASRRVLEEMDFTIKEEEVRGKEYYLLATASDEYEVDVTITPVTSNATKVTVKADSLPDRDQATALEIINQMSTVLSPPPPQLSASLTNQTEENSTAVQAVDGSPPPPPTIPETPPRAIPPPQQPLIAHAPPAIPVVKTVEPVPPQPPTSTWPPESVLKRQSPAVLLTAKHERTEPPNSRQKRQGETLNQRQLYEAALNDYIEGDFPAAIDSLHKYLASSPDGDHPSSGHYWLGESLYSQQEYANALVQFEIILRDYPLTAEAPRAMWKGAHAYRRLGETVRADALLQTLITQYPESREAQLARTLIAER